MLKEMSETILDMLTHITKAGGPHFEHLREHHDFIRMLIRALYGREKEIIDTKQIIVILQNILNSQYKVENQKELNKEFLINTGLIMFILNQIFEKKPNDENIKERIEFVKLIL